MHTPRYTKEAAPKVGAFSNAIGAFSERGKHKAEESFARLFSGFKAESVIHADSILRERIFGPHEAHAMARDFGHAQVDVVLMLDSAFPNGNAFSTLASDPYLAKIPIIITADREPAFTGSSEWETNAWCGVIMNNCAATHMDRFVRPLAGNPDDAAYRDALKALLNVYRTVAVMRNDYLGRFGDAPPGFHSASINELRLTALVGTRIEQVDLSALLNVYKTGKASGLKGEVSFSDADVKATAERMRSGRLCLVTDEMLTAGARLYHALRAVIEASGMTTIAVRCWPELQSGIFPYTPCLAMGQLLADGVVTGAGCESDCLIAVAQSFATHLSGRPSACLDFVNFIGGSDVVQLGHCGVGIPGLMAPNDAKLGAACAGCARVPDELRERITRGEVKVNDAITTSGPPRHGGFTTGPNLVGQFQYGVKTGVCLIESGDSYKMLAFTGENSPETAKGMLYTAADVRVRNHKRLHELILEHGFAHHLAVAMGDITGELEDLCCYYGIVYYNPDKD
ncbi:MAG: hypothetical protein JW889_11375 [Verrucomicrobia bacterium]|nr:hypothetical protein [Verrucomicrobiota bacterium]